MSDHEVLAKMIAAIRPSTTARRNKLGEYNLYDTTAGLRQRCWLFSDAHSDIVVSIFVTIDEAAEPINIRLRTSEEPLRGLALDQVASYVAELMQEMAVPRRLKQLIWNEAAGNSRRFAARVPFHELARAYVLACVADGQKLTMRWIESTIDRLWGPSQAWDEPDLVAMEEGWPQNSGHYLAGVYHACLIVVLRERDSLLARGT